MARFILLVAVATSSGVLFASPIGPNSDAKTLVAGLSDPSEKGRDESSTALRNRADALPWLRRVAKSADKDTARRAVALLAPHEQKRQEFVPKAIDVCIQEGRIDLLTEWHQYWRPKSTDDLWPIGRQATKAGLELYAKVRHPKEAKYFERVLDVVGGKLRAHDGPWVATNSSGTWNIRTDHCDDCPSQVSFASIDGRIWMGNVQWGRFLVLGSVRAHTLQNVFLVFDGDIWHRNDADDRPFGVRTMGSVVVCRGNFHARDAGSAVLLVDGDIDLTGSSIIKSCLIRATGEIRVPPNVAPDNCTIEAHAKNATAPYKFFELSDVGFSLADDEEGLVVTSVKADTPFGNCGIAKGDLVLAIDDLPAGGSEEFRKAVRRAVVRQGDCLITVVRGGKTLDLPVFFPLPK